MPTIANMENVNGIVISGAIPESHTLLRTATASSSSTLSFTSRIDSTFDVYEFHFTNMHPADDDALFQFQVNAAGASGFNETITSTGFSSWHNEGDTSSGLGYEVNLDQGNGTGYQTILTVQAGNDADQASSGVLTLYAPSSKTYVKQFTSVGNTAHYVQYSIVLRIAGYINVTAPIDEISFKFDSGNIDAGVIKMYGVAKS